jgi:hypothetical protein
LGRGQHRSVIKRPFRIERLAGHAHYEHNAKSPAGATGIIIERPFAVRKAAADEAGTPVRHKRSGLAMTTGRKNSSTPAQVGTASPPVLAGKVASSPASPAVAPRACSRGVRRTASYSGLSTRGGTRQPSTIGLIIHIRETSRHHQKLKALYFMASRSGCVPEVF